VVLIFKGVTALKAIVFLLIYGLLSSAISMSRHTASKDTGIND